MRHCFGLPASARSAASRYGHGSGKMRAAAHLGSQRLPKMPTPAARSTVSGPRPSVTETSYGQVKFLGLDHFEQARSDADLCFDLARPNYLEHDRIA